jgi:hypothetical protein
MTEAPLRSPRKGVSSTKNILGLVRLGYFLGADTIPIDKTSILEIELYREVDGRENPKSRAGLSNSVSRNACTSCDQSRGLRMNMGEFNAHSDRTQAMTNDSNRSVKGRIGFKSDFQPDLIAYRQRTHRLNKDSALRNVRPASANLFQPGPKVDFIDQVDSEVLSRLCGRIHRLCPF